MKTMTMTMTMTNTKCWMTAGLLAGLATIAAAQQVVPNVVTKTKTPEGALDDRVKVQYVNLANAKPSVAVLVFGEREASWRSELSEDLKTMGHLLGKTVQHGGSEASRYRISYPSAMGLNLMSGAAVHGAVSAEYIEGFGALFKVGASFPLVAPEDDDGTIRTSIQKKKPSVWERAQEELRGQGQPVGGTARSTTDPNWVGRPEYRIVNPQAPFNAERVAMLQMAVRETLAQAQNIRGLAGDDVVVVQVSGPAPVKVSPRERRVANPPAGGNLPLVIGAVANVTGGTVMNFRVKASELRRLGSGELEKEAFRELVEVHAERR